MEDRILTAIITCFTALVVALFGGWTYLLESLVVVMIIDYVSGICVAGIFHASPKTANGCLESKAGLKGIIKKIMMLALVAVAYHIDVLLATNFVENAVIGALLANEAISILENATLMGISVPTTIKKSLELFSDSENEK